MVDEFVKNKEDENAEETAKNENQSNEDQAQDESPKLEQVNSNSKVAELENQYKRILADYQNLQKRTEQEKQDIYKFASERAVESLIPALDIFDYAKASLNPEADVEKLIKDFNLVFETFLKCFGDMGIEAIDETGIPFDPAVHEPMQQIPTNELPPHTVMQIVKKGYRLKDKLIRPAMVTVSIEEGSSDKES